MTCLFVAATLLGLKLEKPVLEFWGEKSASKSFEIKVVSPDGTLCLCQSAGDFWLISKDEEIELKAFRNKVVIPVAISNKGEILANTTDGITPDQGDGLRGAIISGENVNLLGVGSSLGSLPFKAGGFEKDGNVLGASSLRRGINATTTLVELSGSGARRFDTQDFPTGPMLMGQCSDGLIGTLFIPYIHRKDGNSEFTASTGRAILIRRDRATLMALPDGFKGSQPTAWSPEGPYVAGLLLGDNSCSVIWKSGEIYAYPSEGTRRVWFTPRSITPDGGVIVGNIGDAPPRTAVIWTESGGAQSLLSYLSGLKLDVPKDISFVETAYVSPDGYSIIGSVQATNKKRYLVRISLPKPLKEKESGSTKDGGEFR